MSSKKDLILGVIDFLQSSLEDGTVSDEDKDSIEVAVQCLTDVFDVDLTQKNKVFPKQTLLSIFQAYEKVRDAKASKATSAFPAAATSSVPEEQKAQAELFKAEGNKFVASKQYSSAVHSYTKAIELDPTNKIYYSNRAAAHSASQDHASAIIDAERALEIDPNYAKAYSRLGLAKYASGDAEGAMKAYELGIKAEGNGGSEGMRKGYDTAKARVEEDLQSAVPQDSSLDRSTPSFPDMSALGNMFGGGSGAGGMDFSSLMNNPQIAQMAQQFMSNPSALQGLMSNPSVRNMAERMRNGNMPSMQEMANDPTIADLAKSFLGNGNEV
ncbi:uncharacterized protein V1516DRAFT_207112 [Lipomyces oligophaga]|uniref:uncharacterized protein n=1 Tax=Lipomyces oligophaga TaxID=45792 RepID=UPI0034CDB7E7